MKAFTLLALLGLLFSPAQAFAQTPDLPRPKEPILRRLPQFSSWTITFKYKSDEKKPAAPSSPPPPTNPNVFSDQVADVTVTRTGQVWWEQTHWRGGTHTEIWFYHGLRAGLLPGLKQIVAIPYSAEGDEAFDYRRGDFEGLGWLSLSTYKGVKSYLGKPAFWFESGTASGAVPATGPDAWDGGHEALLSIDTQRLLYVRDGETERTFTYNPTPAAPLVPPDNYMAIFNQMSADLKHLEHKPGPP
jgi:hypothetical protein